MKTQTARFNMKITASIEDNNVVIKAPIVLLIHAFIHKPGNEEWEIVNKELFIKEIVDYLNNGDEIRSARQESGLTDLEYFFDEVMDQVIIYGGSDSVEEKQNNG